MSDDTIRVREQFYILATSSRIDDRTRVLKHGETFAVFDRYGDIHPGGRGELGLYHEGTRFLSRFDVRLGADRPLFLSSTIRDDNALLAVDLANPDVAVGGEIVLPASTYHLFRSVFLWAGACYERFRIHSYALQPVHLELRMLFDADFADIFEVRGIPRRRSGRRLEPELNEVGVVLRYQGLDGVRRQTRIECAPSPSKISASEISISVDLEPKDETNVYVTISSETGTAVAPRRVYEGAFLAAGVERRLMRERLARVGTSNEQFNDWLNRSAADLQMMITSTPQGLYPYAGVPWYNTVFGRDGIITALECLWIEPAVARGVLAHLAATQATQVNPEQEAEPGKIVHETRRGEMAALGEIPFGLYYGSVDATPLFVVLAGKYFQRTGDYALIEQVWPAIERALGWIREYGDRDGDGFVEYFSRGRKGLINQGWKDSVDSVFHRDGNLAEGPIAICEVQGYVYAAKRTAARLAAILRKDALAATLDSEAEELRERFENAFWCEDLSTYALALDGHKRLCRVRSSNAGHALFAGIASPERAARTAATLLADDSFSGWGIRTIPSSEIRYNPMSYHNGSVWPHDNALIAAGLARYDLKTEALTILRGLFDSTLFLEIQRLPELFCGFARRSGEGPTLYPVACSPQAWATASVFLLIQVCLGLTIDGPGRRISFTRPALPEFVQEVRVFNLTIDDGSADILLRRYPEGVEIEVLRQSGDIEILEDPLGSLLAGE
jgi:glycogen debranching enzyme